MDPFALIIYAIIAFIAVLFVLWGIWTYRTYKKGEKVLFAFQLAAFLGGLFWLTWSLELFPGSKGYHESEYFEELTGESFWADEVYSFDPPREFNGDGFSIWIYELDQETIELFSPPSEAFFSGYPIQDEVRSEWKHRNWAESPMADEELPYLNFALMPHIPPKADGRGELKELLNQLEELMKQPGHFYAYNVDVSGTYISNIDLYILSPKEGKLFVVNHNT